MSSSNTESSSTSNVFRVFFPRSRNKKYPTKSSDPEASLFNNDNLPKENEVNVISQLFGDDNVVNNYRKYMHDNNLQNLFIAKILRILFNTNASVEFYVIESSNATTLSSNDIQNSMATTTTTFSASSASSASSTASTSHSTYTAQLKVLSYADAIERIKLYLYNKVNSKKIESKSTKNKVSKTVTPSTNKFQSSKHLLMNLNHTFQTIYPRQERTPTYINTTWFSTIHSLYESFDFIVYDQSHKLHGGVNIHKCLRVRLTFPEGRNFLIIFNGYLAHCGASAIQETGVCSFNFKNSLRLFAYLDKYTSADGSDETGVRTRTNSTRISNQAANVSVDHEYTKLCSENCITCKKTTATYSKKDWISIANSGDGEFKINIMDCFVRADSLRKEILEKQKRKQVRDEKRQTSKPPSSKKSKYSELMKTDYSKPLHICGDINTNGWAVYEGLDVFNHKYLNVMDEMESSINGRGVGNLWTRIHGEGNVGERKYLKFNEIGTTKREKFKHTLKLFKDIEEYIRQINEFEESSLKEEKFTILRNRGNTPEQLIHRDQVNYS